MTDRPLVSIVTPCRNAAQFIEQCVRSVQNQDYPHVEHIVQDGASTDGTVNVLRNSGGKVEWISEPDGGQSDGLNKALQRCRGDIIGVLNGDDEYLPGAASWAVKQLASYPSAAAVYGDKFNIDAFGRVLNISVGPHPYCFDRLFCVEHVLPAQAAFIRRIHFEQVGFFADITRKTVPDYEMWIRLGLKFPIQYVPGLVARYRAHPGSESQQCGLIDLAVESRKEVIERTVNDPSIAPRVKRLRARALAGTYLWAAISKRDTCSHPREVLAYVVRSLQANPSPMTYARVARFFAASAVPARLREMTVVVRQKHQFRAR
jgi:glycosyltransferase involved in cell wall biosynthesis